MLATTEASTVTGSDDENKDMLPSTSSAAKSSSPKCVLDSAVLNENTLSSMQDMGLSVFAVACGKNRGAFVLDEPDGNTYSWYVETQESIFSLIMFSKGSNFLFRHLCFAFHAAFRCQVILLPTCSGSTMLETMSPLLRLLISNSNSRDKT